MTEPGSIRCSGESVLVQSRSEPSRRPRIRSSLAFEELPISEGKRAQHRTSGVRTCRVGGADMCLPSGRPATVPADAASPGSAGRHCRLPACCSGHSAHAVAAGDLRWFASRSRSRSTVARNASVRPGTLDAAIRSAARSKSGHRGRPVRCTDATIVRTRGSGELDARITTRSHERCARSAMYFAVGDCVPAIRGVGDPRGRSIVATARPVGPRARRYFRSRVRVGGRSPPETHHVTVWPPRGWMVQPRFRGVTPRVGQPERRSRSVVDRGVRCRRGAPPTVLRRSSRVAVRRLANDRSDRPSGVAPSRSAGGAVPSGRPRFVLDRLSSI